jgi:hypothetical protein
MEKEQSPGMVLEESDEKLIEGCRRGDSEAFRELFERHKDKVYSTALPGHVSKALHRSEDLSR